jgi:hypothetical protein
MEPQAELQLLYLLLWRVLRNQEKGKMHRLPLQHLQVKMKIFSFSMACCNASTRDVCPVQMSPVFLQNNRVRFGVLQILGRN